MAQNEDFTSFFVLVAKYSQKRIFRLSRRKTGFIPGSKNKVGLICDDLASRRTLRKHAKIGKNADCTLFFDLIAKYSQNRIFRLSRRKTGFIPGSKDKVGLIWDDLAWARRILRKRAKNGTKHGFYVIFRFLGSQTSNSDPGAI